MMLYILYMIYIYNLKKNININDTYKYVIKLNIYYLVENLGPKSF